MKTLTVSVTAEHIKNGVAGSCMRCPIALSMNSERRTIYRVHKDRVCFYSNDKQNILTLPKEAAEFVNSFDELLPVSPFTFTLEIPE